MIAGQCDPRRDKEECIDGNEICKQSVSVQLEWNESSKGNRALSDINEEVLERREDKKYPEQRAMVTQSGRRQGNEFTECPERNHKEEKDDE